MYLQPLKLLYCVLLILMGMDILLQTTLLAKIRLMVIHLTAKTVGFLAEFDESS